LYVYRRAFVLDGRVPDHLEAHYGSDCLLLAQDRVIDIRLFPSQVRGPAYKDSDSLSEVQLGTVRSNMQRMSNQPLERSYANLPQGVCDAGWTRTETQRPSVL
jgi:hypothetical protein